MFIKMEYYSYVGNYFDTIGSSFIDKYYSLRNRRQYDWKPCKYTELPDEIKYLCYEGAKSLNKGDVILTDPPVIVERHHIKFSNKKKINPRARLTDVEGPAGGPCISILYYYQIDSNINNGDLSFYDNDIDEIPKQVFSPTSGDMIAFDNNIFHCPGEYSTTSSSLVTRGLIAMFIKL
jgi:hypothetical protein